MNGQKRAEASSWARRDRQRQYDFPTFPKGGVARPVTIHLGVMTYNLTGAEALELLNRGILRGIAQQASDEQYFCHRCQHRWRGRAEARCPDCLARDWMEYLLLRCSHCEAVFESEQIRYAIGTISYGKGKTENDLCPPYELFPLCPYCGKAHWSPGEEERVREMRQQAARRAARLRLLFLGLALAAILLLGLFFVTGVQ